VRLLADQSEGYAAADAGAYLTRTTEEPGRFDLIARIGDDLMERRLPSQRAWRKRFDEQARD